MTNHYEPIWGNVALPDSLASANHNSRLGSIYCKFLQDFGEVCIF